MFKGILPEKLFLLQSLDNCNSSSQILKWTIGFREITAARLNYSFSFASSFRGADSNNAEENN